MFMTTKTHKRLLADAIEERDEALHYANLNHKNYLAQLSITKSQRIQINEMQHFYNKGRAVHAADVRYEAKKRATKIKVSAS